MPQAVTIRGLPRASDVVKGMAQDWSGARATGGLAGRRLRPFCRVRWVRRSTSISIGWRYSTRPTGATARTGGICERARRDRARGAEPPPLRAERRAARLCAACRATRPHDPGLFCPGTFGAQGPALAPVLCPARLARSSAGA